KADCCHRTPRCTLSALLFMVFLQISGVVAAGGYQRKPAIGAQGRDRTTDTAIFSRMLYQLSYLGIPGRPKGGPSGRFIDRSGAHVRPASPLASPGAARLSAHPQIIEGIRLFLVFGVGGAAGDDVGTGEPAVQVDIAAAAGAEREFGGIGGLAADRAGFRRH